jgi:hypothetical protein
LDFKYFLVDKLDTLYIGGILVLGLGATMQYLKIKKEALDKVTTYLGKRPYIEVFNVFKALQDGIVPLDGVIESGRENEQKTIQKEDFEIHKE